MLAHCGFAAIGVAGEQRVYQLLVRFAHPQHAAGLGGPQAHVGLDHRVQFGDLPQQARLLAETTEVFVEVAVGAGPVQVVAQALLQLVEHAGQAADVLGAHVAHGIAHGQPFEHGAHFEDFAHFLLVQAAHHGAAVGADLDQAFGRQAAQRAAHRHAAGADFAGDDFGHQAVAGRIVAQPDFALQVLVGLFFGADGCLLILQHPRPRVFKAAMIDKRKNNTNWIQ